LQQNFVTLDEVGPLLFYRPYYLEVGKGGDKAYVLLRDALIESGKIAIALVVIRARQHLAAAKPKKKGLMLELMHFPEELLDVSEFKKPVEKAVNKSEMQMAKQLIQSMTSEWTTLGETFLTTGAKLNSGRFSRATEAIAGAIPVIEHHLEMAKKM
jgi:DNA end-binding protein Ku